MTEKREKEMMKSKPIKNKTVLLLIAAIMAFSIVSCGTKTAGDTAEAVEAVNDETTDIEPAGPPYLKKGVYSNYPAEEKEPETDYFYVFYDEGAGYTERGRDGTGVPFCCEQTEGQIIFTFGGEGEAPEVFTVISSDRNMVIGSFEDGKELIFILLPDADPDNFDAVSYTNESIGGTSENDKTYTDANGWSVRYDPEVITVNKMEGAVAFVYTGESAGTNMVTATYIPDKDGKTAIDDLAESWGDGAEKSEGLFPGTEDEKGYFASLTGDPAEAGSGMYSVALARDYMDGALVFELTGHNGNNADMNMDVSDSLAGIIDSIQFDIY